MISYSSAAGRPAVGPGSEAPRCPTKERRLHLDCLKDNLMAVLLLLVNETI